MINLFWCKMVMILVLAAAYTWGAENITIRTVPTYECCSIYLEGTDATPDKFKIQYREDADGKWQDAHPLSSSPTYATPRGSLFNLKADTKYLVQALDLNGNKIAHGAFTTWSNTPPISKTIKMSEYNPNGGPVMIEGGGSENGWIHYIGDGKTIIDGGEKDTEALLIENGSYIILENLIIKGGKRHGIRLLKSSNIRLINCNIYGFGRVGKQKGHVGKQKRKEMGNKYNNGDGKYYDEKNNAINWDAGVYIDRSEKITIEHNYIHDPRNHANSWFYSHPAGPNAVFVNALGEIVIRYNDFIGSDKHRWNDVIEGYGNSKADGGFNRDSDIYGNYLAFANDDGIELDGGQCNVRFWGNKIEGMLCGISTAPNIRGPSYVFNNLVCNLGDERGVGSACVKNGGGSHSQGMTYFYNNTFFTRGNGIAAVGFGKDKNRSDYLATSRNNLLAVSGVGISNENTLKSCNFDYDFFSNVQGEKGKFSLPAQFEKHAKYGNPQFVSAEAGIFSLKPESIALSGATNIPGMFSGKYFGCIAPDQKMLMPYRKNSINPNVNQLIISTVRTDNKTSLRNVSISFKDMPKEQPFSILKNAAFDWLQITPKNGIARPGEVLQLQVIADPSKVKGTGIIPGAFLIKLASGESVPVSVFLKVFQSNYDQTINAVDCVGTELFKTDTVADSGMKYLVFAPDTPRKPGAKSIRAIIDVPANGNYYISLEVNCPEPGPNHDSIFFSVNGGELHTGAVLPGNFWHWINLGTNGLTIPLNKGINTLLLMPREELNLSKIRIRAMQYMAGETPENNQNE